MSVNTEDIKIDDHLESEPKETGNKRKTPWKIYWALTLATWGDNMWDFAGGLFMMELQPENLRLTAIYGLVLSASVICLGSALGQWIDKTSRLVAARTCLFVQNVSVAVSALILSLYLTFGQKSACIQTLRYATICLVILFSTVARLASRGTNIIMEKDWMVAVANRDNDFLAEMNSVSRSIGLTTFILAPALVGQLLTFIGYVWTGLFVALWNLISVGFEWLLLEWIYRTYPALQSSARNEKSNACEISEQPKNEKNSIEDNIEDDVKEPLHCVIDPIDSGTAKDTHGDILSVNKPVKDKNWSENFLSGTFGGWPLFFSHPIRNAGLALAVLYMTVLGFDNITFGYVLTQGIPESITGILVAVSAVIGVLGSVAYPFIRRIVGLERTGLFGFFSQVFISSLAVISIFLPGSPFLLTGHRNETTINDPEDLFQGDVEYSEYISVSTFLFGITIARFGLYIIDLTITQILQERVEEHNRGAINGVQNALNSLFDLIKCILVILLPFPWQFGILIILSFTAISFGWLLYALYSRKMRGHLFHFNQMCHHTHLPNLHHFHHSYPITNRNN